MSDHRIETTINGAKVSLLDNDRMVNQLCSLERCVARSGKDSINHPDGAHDDVINAAESVGALGAFLSGSGSTICAVSLGVPEKIASAMLAAANSPGALTLITAADNRGARILSNRNSAIENRKLQ